jgi:hypothetical protein
MKKSELKTIIRECIEEWGKGKADMHRQKYGKIQDTGIDPLLKKREIGPSRYKGDKGVILKRDMSDEDNRGIPTSNTKSHAPHQSVVGNRNSSGTPLIYRSKYTNSGIRVKRGKFSNIGKPNTNHGENK